MRWLLDTNVVSETIRPRPDNAVLAWIAGQAPDLMAISIVTWAELRAGILSAHDDRRRRELLQWVEVTLPRWLQERILALTIEILTDWLQLGRTLAVRGITREASDLLIASTARIHNLVVVSRNTRDFAGTGVVVYDPWSGETHRMDAP